MKIERLTQVIAGAALIAFVLFPRRANAEVSAHEQIVSLDLGGAVPFAKFSQSNPHEVAGPGFLGAAQYIYQVTPNIGVGADFGYSAYSGKTVGGISNFDPAATTQASMSKLDAEVLGRYIFLAESKFNPYAVMGLGFNSVSAKEVFNSPAIPLNVAIIDGSYTSFAFSIGGGVETQVLKSVIVGCEARWRYLGTHAFDATAAAVADKAAAAGSMTGFGPASEVTLALRVGYLFAGKTP